LMEQVVVTMAAVAAIREVAMMAAVVVMEAVISDPQEFTVNLPL
jgi:hypothetical protein